MQDSGDHRCNGATCFVHVAKVVSQIDLVERLVHISHSDRV